MLLSRLDIGTKLFRVLHNNTRPECCIVAPLDIGTKSVPSLALTSNLRVVLCVCRIMDVKVLDAKILKVVDKAEFESEPDAKPIGSVSSDASELSSDYDSDQRKVSSYEIKNSEKSRERFLKLLEKQPVGDRGAPRWRGSSAVNRLITNVLDLERRIPKFESCQDDSDAYTFACTCQNSSSGVMQFVRVEWRRCGVELREWKLCVLMERVFETCIDNVKTFDGTTAYFANDKAYDVLYERCRKNDIDLVEL